MLSEIEIKAIVRDRVSLMQKLSEKGCVFSKTKTQDDAVFVQNTGPMDTFLSNSVFLRIRIQDGAKVILTAKRPKNVRSENLVKREHEVTVDSAEEARGILDLMGYQEQEAARVKKVRQTAKLGEYEICIDEVEGLGSFIEVERMADESEAPEILKQIEEFLAELGVQPEDKVSKGYDILMLEKASE